MNLTTLRDNKKLVIMIAAFAAIYLLWGSTYLAIKYAIETFPPFIMAGTRFVFAGAVLLLIASRSADFEIPKAVHWRTSLIVGTLLLLGGNGGVVLAQQYISSSLAALLVAVEPFFVILLSWLWLKKGRPNLLTTIGLVIGFVGVALLVTGQTTNGGILNGGMSQWLGTFAVIGAALSWAAGSIYGLKAPVPKSSLLTAGLQMISGGTMLMLVSLIRGEWWAFDPSAISSRSWAAVGYLILFGSLVGFTAYSWLLKNADPSKVATYAYVNPVVAVLLGWGVAGESLTLQMMIGAAIVVVSVALVTRQKSLKDSDPEEITIHRSQTPSSSQPSFSTSS